MPSGAETLTRSNYWVGLVRTSARASASLAGNAVEGHRELSATYGTMTHAVKMVEFVALGRALRYIRWLLCTAMTHCTSFDTAPHVSMEIMNEPPHEHALSTCAYAVYSYGSVIRYGWPRDECIDGWLTGPRAPAVT